MQIFGISSIFTPSNDALMGIDHAKIELSGQIKCTSPKSDFKLSLGFYQLDASLSFH